MIFSAYSISLYQRGFLKLMPGYIRYGPTLGWFRGYYVLLLLYPPLRETCNILYLLYVYGVHIASYLKSMLTFSFSSRNAESPHSLHRISLLYSTLWGFSFSYATRKAVTSSNCSHVSRSPSSKTRLFSAPAAIPPLPKKKHILFSFSMSYLAFL